MTSHSSNNAQFLKGLPFAPLAMDFGEIKALIESIKDSDSQSGSSKEFFFFAAL